MRIDEGEFVGSDVFFQKDRLVLRYRGEMANPGAHFIGIEVQALGNQVRIRIEVAGRIAQQQRGK